MFDYRLYRDEDRAAIGQLWEEETEWGPLTDHFWKRWYEESAYGRPVVAVATDRSNDEVIGQFVFQPSLVSIRGRIVRACRPFAPIVRKDLHLFGGHDFRKHPSFGMFECARNEMRNRGAGLLYMLPDSKWVRVMKKLGMFQYSAFQFSQLPLPLPATFPVDADYRIGEAEPTGAEVDGLWQAAADKFDCTAVRNSLTLPWRSGDDRVMTVRRGSELAAVVVSRNEGEKRQQWMIRDLLWAGDKNTLRNVLALICNCAHSEAAADPAQPVTKVGTVVPRVMEATLHDLGFELHEYYYPLAVHVMDPAIPEEDVAPERWFVTGND